MTDDRFAAAVRLKQEGQYEEAIALLQTLIAERPEDARYWHEIGLIYSYRVEIEESIAALERSCELDPDSRSYLYNLGKTYTMYGDREAAKRVFERLRELGDWFI